MRVPLLSPVSPLKLTQAFFAALLEGDRAGASAALAQALDDGATPDDALRCTVTPAMRQLGELRALGELDDHDLACAAAISTAAVSAALPAHETPDSLAVVVSMDAHQLGARCVAGALQAEGWEVEVLEACSVDALISYSALRRPALVAISVARDDLVASARRLERGLRALAAPPEVLVGGAAVLAQ